MSHLCCHNFYFFLWRHQCATNRCTYLLLYHITGKLVAWQKVLINYAALLWWASISSVVGQGGQLKLPVLFRYPEQVLWDYEGSSSTYLAFPAYRDAPQRISGYISISEKVKIFCLQRPILDLQGCISISGGSLHRSQHGATEPRKSLVPHASTRDWLTQPIPPGWQGKLGILNLPRPTSGTYWDTSG